jgi:type I restriction enzyme, S subunit
MAKGKMVDDKKKVLRQAVLPKEEQPYEIPENWVWTRIENINHFKGITIDPMKHKDTTFELYSVPSYENNYPEVVYGENIGSTKQLVLKDDVLLCKINPRINRVWDVSKYTENILIASSEWIVIRNSHINTKYLKWCLMSHYFREYMLSNVSGVGGSLMRAQPKSVKLYPIPLAPVAEQERIVRIIENMFLQLDHAKDVIQGSIDSFEKRKAAILQYAIKGELSADWREKQGIEKDTTWEYKKIGELCGNLQYGTSSKSQEQGRVAVIRMGNLQEGEVDWSNLAFTDNENDIVKYLLQPGDVLFNRTNSPELVGKTSIYRGEIPAIFAGYLIRLNYDKTKIVGEYLNYILNSSLAKDYCKSVKTDGVNQSNINAKKIAAFEIPVPSFAEQTEIVRVLNDILRKEQKAKELYEVTEKVNVIKNSILSRAFRGELGTNNDEDESGLVLLEKTIFDHI